MADLPSPPLFDRDLSWLSFNERVLQEAEDTTLPLYDRIDFLAIVSSNLDEFFRVRVASIRALLRLKKKSRRGVVHQPRRLLRDIGKRVQVQQERLGHVFRSQILPALAEHDVYLVDETRVPDDLLPEILSFFEENLREALVSHELRPGSPSPFLEDQAIYLVSALRPQHPSDSSVRWGLTKLPEDVPRFHVVRESTRTTVLFIDDLVRIGLPFLFPTYHVGRSFAIKLSRDADLDLADEFSGDLVSKIKSALKKRSEGVPSRLLYDPSSPYDLIQFLTETFSLSREDLVRGGRYHNLHGLRDFPDLGLRGVRRPSLPRLPHPELHHASSVLQCIAERDQLLHTPYHDVEPLLRFVEEAASDPDVTTVSATLYRVAAGSRIVEGLIKAARRGAMATAFVEVKARFDEAHNLACAERMQKAGVRILYSMPGLKVHAKLVLVSRKTPDGVESFAYVGTGNLNEVTSRIYADHGLFTADKTITQDIQKVFDFLGAAKGSGEDATRPYPDTERVLVAPATLRSGLYEHIAYEEQQVAEGHVGRVVMKLNALEDPEMVSRLYEASQAGVSIRLLVRGICCLVPGVAGFSERIVVTSIVDRFLEHARIYLFRAGGEDHVYLSSADMMERNLNRRIEVACPVLEPRLKAELKQILALQMADTRKSRVIDAAQSNAFVAGGRSGTTAQEAIHAYLAQRATS